MGSRGHSGPSRVIESHKWSKGFQEVHWTPLNPLGSYWSLLNPLVLLSLPLTPLHQGEPSGAQGSLGEPRGFSVRIQDLVHATPDKTSTPTQDITCENNSILREIVTGEKFTLGEKCL